MVVLNSLFPIFVLLLLGGILKQRGLTTNSFLATGDKLIYYFFFPVMLFWKIGGSSFREGMDIRFCLATLLSLVTIILVSLVVIKLFRVSNFQAGSFSQSCYRFNTYIGVAVILNSFGGEGVKYFGLLIAFAIPLINVFAVSTLIWFSGQEITLRKRVAITSRALVANPLILGCLSGILYSRFIGWFPVFIDNSFALISMVALPLALLSIGGNLTFTGVRGNLKQSMIASVIKLVFLPATGCLYYYLFGITGIKLKVGMIFFALPASTAIYVLSSQMNSDTELASSAIVVSTLLSFLSLSFVLLI
ncbi:MAG: AEC family transporter [Desulforhopalus sp.]